jgi:hypothetical protein
LQSARLVAAIAELIVRHACTVVVNQTDKAGELLVRIVNYAVCNGLLFAAFSVLWVKQYHVTGDLSDRIDLVVVPWLWLAGFFIASFFAIRRPRIIAILVSIASAVAFAAILFLFIHLVLVPMYDPMF